MKTLAERKVALLEVLTEEQVAQLRYAVDERDETLEKLCDEIQKTMLLFRGTEGEYGLIQLLQPLSRADDQGDHERDKPKRKKKEKQEDAFEVTPGQTVDEALDGVEAEAEKRRIDGLLIEALSVDGLQRFEKYQHGGIADIGIADELKAIWPALAENVTGGDPIIYQYGMQGGFIPRFSYLPAGVVATEQSTGIVDLTGEKLMDRVRRVLSLPELNTDDTCKECLGRINPENNRCESCGASAVPVPAAVELPEPSDEELTAIAQADENAEAVEAAVAAGVGADAE